MLKWGIAFLVLSVFVYLLYRLRLSASLGSKKESDHHHYTLKI
jgi:hypothetical protein